MPNNHPTHRLVIIEKANKKNRTNAGAAWRHENNWFSIKLKPGIVISHRDCEDFYLSLYPVHEAEQPKEQQVTDPAMEEDDDIPF